MLKLCLVIFILIGNPLLFASTPVCQKTDCQNKLTGLSEFQDLQSEVRLGAKSLKVVKIIYHRDFHGGGTVYFLNTKRFPFHFDFVETFLGYKGDLTEFNRNYLGSGEKREFNQASLIFWPESATYPKGMLLMELWNGDVMDIKYVVELFQKIKENLVIDVPMQFHPLGLAQEQMMQASSNALPFINTIELFKDVSYLPMNQGIAYGYLKEVKEGADDCLDYTHIAFFQSMPNDLGLVGGVITEEAQTPLGHINVKSMNRGTVNISLKNARNLLKKYLGKPIKLTAGGDSYQIELLPEAQAGKLIEDFWKTRRPKVKFDATAILDHPYAKRFAPLDSIFKKMPSKKDHQYWARIIGAKATNLAVLSTLAPKHADDKLGFSVPEGYGIPFNFYDLFMQFRQTGLDPANPQVESSPKEMILRILEREQLLDAQRAHSFCQAKPALQEIRDLILRAQVPEEMLGIFKNILLEDEKSPIHQSKISRIRLRSSTNSEDMEGFTGAGLYNSAGLWLYGKDEAEGRSSDKPLSWKKIKQNLQEKIPFIYSSVWNDRAFEEREWYSIKGKKHLAIKVGIALHEGVPYKDLDGKDGEVANGVAITANIFSQDDFGKVYINGQHFDLAVTNPPTPEELQERDPGSPSSYSTEEILVNTETADEELNETPDGWPQWSYEILSRSSVLQSRPVLRDDPKEKKSEQKMEVRRMATIFKNLSDQFAGIFKQDPEQFALDIEWKLVGKKRQLHIKQARPFSASPRKDLPL
ncbi:MAG: hypothetical protein A2X86_20860 [Bdellovibrionales bacterium GWA2_49_15]|nr:MAG: hypothetical protein A2X86_20860 [Bdellovibrionales bacterium GWA2_49_15]HAZ13150.1 hypothetical protein [Bdellovibrionales bacterium]